MPCRRAQPSSTASGTTPIGGRIQLVSIDDIEAEVLKLDPSARARLVKKFLGSLRPCPTRRMSASGRRKPIGAMLLGDSVPGSGRSAADVFRDARAKLR